MQVKGLKILLDYQKSDGLNILKTLLVHFIIKSLKVHLFLVTPLPGLSLLFIESLSLKTPE